MNASLRKLILRANAVFLMVASAGGLYSDLVGAFMGQGSVGIILADAPHAAIGFVEAHGLAFIIGALLLRAEPLRSWHLTAACVHMLLGGANLAFWDIFAAADMVLAGYVTTALHGVFASIQLVAGMAARETPKAV